MAQDVSKTCFNCFWEWEDEGFSRCTRLPPAPLLHNPVGFDMRANTVSYTPCPGRPACGEWQEIDLGDTVLMEEIEEVLGEQRKT